MTPSHAPSTHEEVQAQALAALRLMERAERRVGHALVGAHRDDLAVTLDGHPAREFASQGQLRAAVLALRLSEIRHAEAMLGECPVLLLDDVSSELDATRNAQLFEVINDFRGQTVITTTDRRFIQVHGDTRTFRLVEGARLCQGCG